MHKFLTQNQWKPLNLSQKDKHNTKQIKYRRKLKLVLPHLYGGELTAYVEGGEDVKCYCLEGDSFSFFLSLDGLRVRNSRHSTSSETLCVRKICS